MIALLFSAHQRLTSMHARTPYSVNCTIVVINSEQDQGNLCRDFCKILIFFTRVCDFSIIICYIQKCDEAVLEDFTSSGISQYLSDGTELLLYYHALPC